MVFAIFLMVALALPGVAKAYTFSAVTPSGHVLYYDIIEGGAEVAKCNYNYPNYGSSLDGDLVIPDSVEYNGVVYAVVSIGFEAFEYATMRTVQIPNTVVAIQIRAFTACDSLTSLIIPNSVSSIGRQAFAGSFNITSIVLPDSLAAISQGVFENDTSLVSLVVPDAVTSVGYGAFSQCYSLRSVTFGSSVSSIEGLMFWNCYGLDSLIFRSDVAPMVGANLFVGASDSLVILAPCGSYHAYMSAFGSNHTYVVPSVDLTIGVSSAMPDWGTASVIQDADLQDVRCDSSAVVQALSNYGYHFVQWSNGSTAFRDTLFLEGDSTLTASFAKNQYAVIVSSSNNDVGSVSGGGTFEYLDTAILSANAIAPYHFVGWSDGSAQNPRTLVVTGDKYLAAIFGIDTFAVNLQVDTITHGTCTGFGNYPYGSAASVVAIPYSGYLFSHWSDGTTDNPYTFAVVDNVQLTAYFYANGTPYQDTLVLHDTMLVEVPVHDTTHVDVPYAVHDTTIVNNYIYDTIVSYINHYIHDTVFVNNYIYIHDTVINHVNHYIHDTSFVNNYIHDTTFINNYIHDTTFVNNYIHDTLWLTQHDTIVIHDTIYVTENVINEVTTANIRLYQRNGCIVIEDVDDGVLPEVSVFDAVGRRLNGERRVGSGEFEIAVPASGVYLVKIGEKPARRVVVVR